MGSGRESLYRNTHTRPRPSSSLQRVEPRSLGRRAAPSAILRAWASRSSSTAIQDTTTRSRCCWRSRAPRSRCSASPPCTGTRRSRRRRRTPCACSTSPAAATSRSPPGPIGPLVRELTVASHVHGESGLDGPALPAASRAPLAEGAVEFMAADDRGEPGAGHARADRAAHERRPPARAHGRRERGAHRPHGRLDRRGQHDAGGRVQHLGRSRGRRRRLRSRHRHDHDRPRRDPPGGDDPCSCRSGCARPERRARSSPTSSTSSRSSTARPTAGRARRSTMPSPWRT